MMDICRPSAKSLYQTDVDVAIGVQSSKKMLGGWRGAQVLGAAGAVRRASFL